MAVPAQEPAEASNWFVSVPRSLAQTSQQATRSLRGATRAGHRQLLIEASLPELEPSSETYRFIEMLTFAQQIGLSLLESGLLPPARPHVKLLFGSAGDATVAGGLTQYTDMPVSVVGASTAMGPRDGAFVFVSPRAGPQSEAALADIVDKASGRPVVLINPRLGQSAALRGFMPAYLIRPLSVTYLEDAMAKEASRASACLLHCYPHEYSVLINPEPKNAARQWVYAGRFSACPAPAQIETMVRDGMMRERFSDA